VLDGLRADGVEIRIGAAVVRAESTADGVLLRLMGGETIEGSHLLVAAGRAPNVEELGLETAGIEYSAGGITVDKRLRTTNPAVYAAGDVTGRPAYTHAAGAHAALLIRKLLFAQRADVEKLVVDPIEDALGELEDVKTIKTRIEDGLAVVLVEFEADSDADRKYEETLREVNTLRPSLPADLRARAVLLDRAPSDIVGGNRSRLSDGDRMVQLPDVWRERFTEPRLLDRVTRMAEGAEAGSGFDEGDHHRLALTTDPKGLPASELDDAQRELLRTLLSAYVGRVPDGLAPDVDLDTVHLAWAGSTEPGQPHYYRLQGGRLLVEWDNTARDANHAHSVWRDLRADFGLDVLAEHRARHHAG